MSNKMVLWWQILKHNRDKVIFKNRFRGAVFSGLGPQDLPNAHRVPVPASPAGDSPVRFSSSESAKTSASSWSDMSVSSVRSRRSKCTSREDTLLSGSGGGVRVTGAVVRGVPCPHEAQGRPRALGKAQHGPQLCSPHSGPNAFWGAPLINGTAEAQRAKSLKSSLLVTLGKCLDRMWPLVPTPRGSQVPMEHARQLPYTYASVL